jgi:hypothetical protein
MGPEQISGIPESRPLTEEEIIKNSNDKRHNELCEMLGLSVDTPHEKVVAEMKAAGDRNYRKSLGLPPDATDEEASIAFKSDYRDRVNILRQNDSQKAGEISPSSDTGGDEFEKQLGDAIPLMRQARELHKINKTNEATENLPEVEDAQDIYELFEILRKKQVIQSDNPDYPEEKISATSYIAEIGNIQNYIAEVIVSGLDKKKISDYVFSTQLSLKYRKLTDKVWELLQKKYKL